MRKSSVLAAVTIVVLAAPLATAVTVEFPAGYEFYAVEAGTAFLDFSMEPIPADFFEPGSEPFSGIVAMEGVPLVSHPTCPGEDLSSVHVIQHRLTSLTLPDGTDDGEVDSQIIAMSMQSIAPITVSFQAGPPKQFVVRIGPSVSEPVRKRSFFVVDRSIPVVFEPGVNHNIEKTILIESFIEK